MKYPNPTFLTKASSIRKTRHTRTIVILSVLTALTLIIAFVAYVASFQSEYEKRFPDLVGAATSTASPEKTTETSSSATGTSSTEASESTDEIQVTESSGTDITGPSSGDPADPSSVTDGTGETSATSETTQNNSPDIWEEGENVYFKNTHPVQTLSHEERDMLLDDLKQVVTDYISNSPEDRICFRYVNLASNESLGINDLEPFIPAGSFTLPIEIVFYDRVVQGLISLDGVVTYNGEPASGNSSLIASTYKEGKRFFLRTIANYAIAENDTYALSVLLSRLGGIDYIWPYLNKISAYINYTEPVTYIDRTGTRQRGTGRTSAYDMAEYAGYLYHGYINDPDKYQHLINDLAGSNVPTVYTQSFGSDALILHSCGRNVTTGSFTDVAIIDGKEPIVLVISCESESEERANIIQADLSTYVSRYISLCHNQG